MTDLYKELGVKKDATEAQIKRAYKKLAGKHHPDKGGDKETFQKIQNAYAVLSDSERRKQYDETGDTSRNGPVSIEAQATELIIQLLFKLMSQNDFASTDYIYLTKQALENDKGAIKRHLRKLDKKMERVNYILNNIEVTPVIYERLYGIQETLDREYRDGQQAQEVTEFAATLVLKFKYNGNVEQKKPSFGLLANNFIDPHIA